MVSVSTILPKDGPVAPAVVDAWLDTLGDPRAAEDVALVRKACDLAVRAFGVAVDDRGESPLLQRLHVADILNTLALDAETVAAAILHGVEALPGNDAKSLAEGFGPTVAGMLRDLGRVGAVAALGGPTPDQPESAHSENLRRLLLTIAEDVRVVLIVLAERLQAMRRLKRRPRDEQVRIARETMEIYAPLANRLGVWQVKWELEDLGLRYLDPEEYARIASLLDGRRKEREGFIESVIASVQSEFARHGIKAAVSGRPKHIYSIYRKMQRKGVDFDRIFDVRALRVLVEDIADCYAALGVVHGLWPHIPGEFDDYIATPKANMYQSLHTAVVGPDDRPLEVQIRTHDMHDHAERGVAAHWLYKERGQRDVELERRVHWMRRWLELKEDADDPAFVERFKSEFQPVRIYVLTPHGRVIELPRGATPLDFAYAVHSEIGHRCRGAKVDGRIVPLTQPLASGQTVEILTCKEGGPSRDWMSAHLGYLKTAKALNRVRAWFKQQDHDQHAAAGRAALDKELARAGAPKPDLEKLAARFSFRTPSDLLAAVGRGDISAQQLAQTEERRRPPEPEPTFVERPRRPAKAAEPSRGLVVVEGVGDLMTHMAKCCKPVPRDPIVGYITRGRGVTVHRRDCPVVTTLPPEHESRLVNVVWNERLAAEPGAYIVDVAILASDRKGLLRDVSAVFTNEEVDVLAVHTQSDRKTERASMRFTAEIKDLNQLRRILDKLSQIPDILDVRRGT